MRSVTLRPLIPMSDSERFEDKPASLLTKTQRSRIRDGFADQDEHQRRRDQQQIRERVRAGVTDFELLADYPDRQFELAFDDLDEEEVTAALADARLVTERLRALQGIDRDRVVDRASDRASAVSRRIADGESLAGVELVPAATYRQQGRAAAEAEHENRWDRRADAILKTAAVAALPLLLGWFADTVTEQNLLATRADIALVMGLSALVVLAGFAGVLLIKGAQALKHDIIPGVRRLRHEPGAVVSDGSALLRRPGTKLRSVWEEL
ncbi:hypothetical protein [Haloarcula montana]|uniref:hypothetical protein n=1 Tax=Haloarcula montana TaxID=3111776 RepID=UPI002D78A813|nr:hypothetical protein [Haloarcula sp. GH36]